MNRKEMFQPANKANAQSPSEALDKIGSVQIIPQPPKKGESWNYFDPDGRVNETAFFFLYYLRHPNQRTEEDWAFYRQVSSHFRECNHQPSCLDRYHRYVENSIKAETNLENF